jgi:hypothetical protein
MTPVALHASRARIPGRVDQVTVVLLRSAMDERLTPEVAADELLLRTGADSRLLRRVRARLSRAMLERPSHIRHRASATLDRALTTALTRERFGARQAGLPSIPSQGSSHE